jgi:hypothetical protein
MPFCSTITRANSPRPAGVGSDVPRPGQVALDQTTGLERGHGPRSLRPGATQAHGRQGAGDRERRTDGGLSHHFQLMEPREIEWVRLSRPYLEGVTPDDVDRSAGVAAGEVE